MPTGRVVFVSQLRVGCVPWAGWILRGLRAFLVAIPTAHPCHCRLELPGSAPLPPSSSSSSSSLPLQEPHRSSKRPFTISRGTSKGEPGVPSLLSFTTYTTAPRSLKSLRYRALHHQQSPPRQRAEVSRRSHSGRAQTRSASRPTTGWGRAGKRDE